MELSVIFDDDFFHQAVLGHMELSVHSDRDIARESARNVHSAGVINKRVQGRSSGEDVHSSEAVDIRVFRRAAVKDPEIASAVDDRAVIDLAGIHFAGLVCEHDSDMDKRQVRFASHSQIQCIDRETERVGNAGDVDRSVHLEDAEFRSRAVLDRDGPVESFQIVGEQIDARRLVSAHGERADRRSLDLGETVHKRDIPSGRPRQVEFKDRSGVHVNVRPVQEIQCAFERAAAGNIQSARTVDRDVFRHTARRDPKAAVGVDDGVACQRAGPDD